MASEVAYMASIAEQQADQIPQDTVLGRNSTGTPECSRVNDSARKSSFSKSIAVLLLTWVLSVGWLGIHLNRGWVPHDDGMLAQTGERVLSGQLPHRDFDDVYTGGLSYLNAAAFKIFGMNLMSLRIMLLVFFAMWVPAVYFCASRFASPLAAGLVTLLSVAWSVPNYPAGMPSWYNLFFATFGVAALLEYLDTRATRWLFVAGLCGGLSCLIKSPGIYFVAAALLFFVYLEQSEARENAGTVPAPPTHSSNLYRIFLTASVMALVACLTLLVRSIATLPRVYQFVLPGLALGLLLLARESSPASLGSGARFRNLFRLALPFAAGVVAPIALFLIPYAVSHSLRSIYEGVFVTPFQRLRMADFPPPTIGDLIATVPLMGLLALAWYSKRRESWVIGGAVAALLVLLIIVAPGDF
nr:glycosyltransferase family 39 protein [Candidatus Acidoferrales bacterium]